MAPGGATAYHSDVADVIHEPQLADPNALYVWAGATGPQWGNWAAFGAAKTTRAFFPDLDWKAAIESAKAHADRTGIATVYVIHNA
jgi:hypothetical protein